MLPTITKPANPVWRLVLLAAIVVVSLFALQGCDDSDSDSLTPPPATVISAETPTVEAPQEGTSAPPPPVEPAPTATPEDYPKPTAPTLTPVAYPTQ